MRKLIAILLASFLCMSAIGQKKIERLDRGLYACRNHADNGNFLSWRIFGTEWENGAPTVSFNVYRNGTTLLTPVPISKSNFLDAGADPSSTYTIKTVVNGAETEVFEAGTWPSPWLGIKLNVPNGGTAPDGVNYSYSPNDMSVADVDADRQLEYILKWDPSNSKDNANSGYSGNTILDCYEIDGTLKWRIDLGKNIRAGAHYTPFMVYDLDNDGKAELVCKTAPGTKDGTGNYLSKGPAAADNDGADYRNDSGYILEGPEYLTVFNGASGAEMATVYYQVARGNVSDWGDSYGNRLDRYLAAVAYLDGKNPSVVMCRGYYTRTVLVAWDWDGTDLTQRWIFDTGHGNSAEKGQGNHNLAVGDLDGDGYDEIQYGAMAIDHDGTLLYNTHFGHGDAGHLTDMDPNLDGLEYFMPHEHSPYGVHAINTKSQNILFSTTSGGDNGRGVCYDVDPNNFGYECWSYDGKGMTDIYGNFLHSGLPTTAGGGVTMNFGVWWDGDQMRELLDKTVLTKYRASDEGTDRVWSIYNDLAADMNNGSKNNPCLVGDILGDWREEIILRAASNDYIYILTTTAETDYNYYTLLHDPQYREAIAWQNVGYNQPPHPSFYLGTGMSAPPTPDIVYTAGEPDCTGEVGGSATTDECGRCAGGSTGIYPCAQFDEGYYKITAFTNSLSMSSTDDFTQQEAIALDRTQIWKFEKWGNNYKIFSLAQEAYLSYETAGDGEDLSFGGTNTEFYFEQNPDGNYVIIPATNSSYVLDVPNCSATEGLAMNFWSRLNNDCQSFNIEPAETLFDCNGIWEGTAYVDNCQTCIGGTTGLKACPTIQAENACSYNGVVEDIHPGFKGDSYVNLYNEIATAITFTIWSTAPKTINISIHFANGGTNARPVDVIVNGTTQIAGQDVPTTGSWEIWEETSISVELSMGENTIELISTTSEGGANYDFFSFTNEDGLVLSCDDQNTTQTTVLHDGWNLFSTFILAEDYSIETLFKGLDISQVKSQDGFWSNSQPVFLNSLLSIKPGAGYLVYANGGGNFQMTGMTLLSAPADSIYDGWNLIGAPAKPVPFPDHFNTENIQYIKNFDGYWQPDGETYLINSVEPGKAYFIKK